jgi:hypothetical protein
MAVPLPKSLITARFSDDRRLHTRVFGNGSTIKLSGPLVTNATETYTRRELISRLFSIPALIQLKTERRISVLTLRFSNYGFERSELLEAVAAAMRQETPKRWPFPNEHLLSSPAFRNRFEVNRVGHRLTLWRILREQGRLVLSHPLLRHDKIRAAVLYSVLGLSGVRSAFSQSERIFTTCESRLSESDLLDVLESIIASLLPLAKSTKSLASLQPALVRSNLVLAAISDFIFPPLGLANAVLVLLLSGRHVRPALKRLGQGQAGLDLLYTCVAACALTAFTFLPSALMYWLLPFWTQRSKRVRRESELNFLAQFRRRPRRVLRIREGESTEINLRELSAGDLVLLKEGDTVPADGIVVDGEAEVEEWLLAKSQYPAKKREDSTIFASDRILRGNLQVRISSEYGDAAADRLYKLYNHAFNREKTSARSARFADHMALPILLLGLAALGRGGPEMTKAVIRPDYLSGPAVAEEFGDLWVLLRAAKAGILIFDTGTLDRLMKADCWILDDTVSWRLGNTNGEFATGLVNSGREIVFLTTGVGKRIGILARKCGLRVQEGTSSAAKVTFIAQRQAYGESVVYVGDCEAEPETAKQADVAVMVSEGRGQIGVDRPISFLAPELDKIATLHSIVRMRDAEIKGAFTTATLPNLAAAIAGVYLSSPALLSVLFTTVGAAACYRHAMRLLREASQELEPA